MIPVVLNCAVTVVVSGLSTALTSIVAQTMQREGSPTVTNVSLLLKIFIFVSAMSNEYYNDECRGVLFDFSQLHRH